MKKFITNLFIFSFLTLCCFILFWKVICLAREQSLRFPNKENIVFLGNSHIECDINDSIIKNCVNFGRSNDYPEQIYCKLKLLKQSNPQLDTLIIGYDNVVMQQNLEEEISGTYSPYYYDQYTFDDINAIINNSSYDYVKSHFNHPFNIHKIGTALPYFIGKTTNITKMKNLGRYEYLVRDKLNQHIEIEKNKTARQSSFDYLSKYFLNKTIDFCEMNNITIIFLSTPQHHQSKIDTITYRDYIHKNYSNTKFYDMRDFRLPDSCFGDLNHLNHKGSKIFSEYLEKEILHKNNYIKQ